MSGKLKKALEQEGLTAFVDRSGRRWTLDNYAKMASYTVTQEALVTATKIVLLEQGYDLVDINSVDDPCERICAEYDGKTFSLSGRDLEFDRLEEFPPFHGFCRHFIYPSSIEVERREKAGVPETELLIASGIAVPEGFTVPQKVRL